MSNSTVAKGDFSSNLRFLCGYYKSVSHVCRKLDINRTQFNRYLTGKSKPNANLMKKICDFFGVEDAEIALPHDDFLKILSVDKSEPNEKDQGLIHPKIAEEFHHLNEVGKQNLNKYAGYYFEYQLSMTQPGRVLKSLVCIKPQDGVVFIQRIERAKGAFDKKPHCDSYGGVVLFLGDRIFVTDCSDITGVEITQTILYPSFKKNVTHLTGIKLGVSANSERAPCAVRVLMTYIGKSINFKEMLRECNLYDLSEEHFDKFILDSLTNDIADSEWQLRAKLT